MTDPTTAIAEIALVSDISGVCSSRETFRITSSPVNVANINTYSNVKKSAFGAVAGGAVAKSKRLRQHRSSFVLSLQVFYRGEILTKLRGLAVFVQRLS